MSVHSLPAAGAREKRCRHVAIIMDGNGRWAAARGLPRVAGHREGAKAVRRTVEAAARAGVEVLTLYAFSSDNWNRPASEVSTLMKLLRATLRKEKRSLIENGIRLRMIGRRDRLDPKLVREVELAEVETSVGEQMQLRVAVDYSARDAILRAVALCTADGEDLPTRAEFAEALGEACAASAASSDVDLLIRTGGEKRLSDFLLWEAAYAELHFTEVMWPDYDEEAFHRALSDFQHRERRYGRVGPVAVKKKQ